MLKFSTLAGFVLLLSALICVTPAVQAQTDKELMEECQKVFLNIAFKMAFAESGVSLDSAQTDSMIELLRKTDPKTYSDVENSVAEACTQLRAGIKEGMSESKESKK